MEEQLRKLKIDAAGVVTTGRIGFADTFRCIDNTGWILDIPTSRNTVAYWEQGITTAIIAALEMKRKYLLFYDGDGIWNYQDVVDLYRIIEADDEMDAVVPVQADRYGCKPLAHAWQSTGGREYDFSTPTTPIVHGHFGLTFIRSSVFERMPQPWFWSRPGQDGTWEKKPFGSMDGDTYFWVKLNETLHANGKDSRYVAQANYTVVGHLELHIRWQVGGKIIVQTLPEYYRDGKPAGCRNPLCDEVPSAHEHRQKPTQDMLITKMGVGEREQKLALGKPTEPDSDTIPEDPKPFMTETNEGTT